MTQTVNDATRNYSAASQAAQSAAAAVLAISSTGDAVPSDVLNESILADTTAEFAWHTLDFICEQNGVESPQRSWFSAFSR